MINFSDRPNDNVVENLDSLNFEVVKAHVSLQTARHIHTKTRTVTTNPNTITPPAVPMIAALSRGMEYYKLNV